MYAMFTHLFCILTHIRDANKELLVNLLSLLNSNDAKNLIEILNHLNYDDYFTSEEKDTKKFFVLLKEYLHTCTDENKSQR
jgi:adenine C2-methylase RlmN of 23S rRNA A2503 and tRNA A37